MASAIDGIRLLGGLYLRWPGVAAHHAPFSTGPARHGRILEVFGLRDCPKLDVGSNTTSMASITRCGVVGKPMASCVATEGRRRIEMTSGVHGQLSIEL
jgi:hypothetical protein